jgi:hypothetical protein
MFLFKNVRIALFIYILSVFNNSQPTYPYVLLFLQHQSRAGVGYECYTQNLRSIRGFAEPSSCVIGGLHCILKQQEDVVTGQGKKILLFNVYILYAIRTKGVLCYISLVNVCDYLRQIMLFQPHKHGRIYDTEYVKYRISSSTSLLRCCGEQVIIKYLSICGHQKLQN